jgi:hypothetical protein
MHLIKTLHGKQMIYAWVQPHLIQDGDALLNSPEN